MFMMWLPYGVINYNCKSLRPTQTLFAPVTLTRGDTDPYWHLRAVLT